MARHLIKPKYNQQENIQKMIDEVVAYFGEPYDDRDEFPNTKVSLRDVSKKFNISVLKARKILITAKHYSIEQSRMVNELYEQNKSVVEIMELTGLSRSSVQSYLPYSKTIYNLEQKSVGADRQERWRRKKR
ncbi:MAG: hypothetical protein J6H31_12780 [Butyrivibrio sp.]|nr:hypothetical protein [Butyrivibrio sp.]